MTFEQNTFDAAARPSGGPSPARTLRRLMNVRVALSGLALAITPLCLHAQRVQPTVQWTIDSVRADGSIKAVAIPRPNPFSLFAAEDLAAGALRMSGGFRSGVTNQGGPVSENQGNNFIQMGRVNNNAGYMFFEMGVTMAAPPSEFRKIRAVHPGINNMAGSLGYSSQYWQVLVPPQIKKIGSADGQFGKAFSGVTSIFNSSCRDDPTFLNQGFSLMAMKDCPETWGSQGFAAKLVVPDSVWLNTFNENKANFRWDDWKLSRARLDATQTLGTQSVYGFMSDYYREQKLRYGTVVPGGSGAPSDPGYPLGIEMRIDSWQLAAPSTRNTQFYQIQLVNKSADVYGTGIDYDSLYYGLGPGFLQNGQAVAVYYDFSSNTIFATGGGTSGNCSTTYPKRYANGANDACLGGGFGAFGVYTMTLLKSPLGDLRNKLFSNPNSPYYNPSSPLADDTITFNHAKRNSFGQTSQNINRSMRSGFGMMSSTELNYMDGRNPSDFTIANFTQLIGPPDWSGSFPTLEDVKFPKFVPGNTINSLNGQPFGKWDYNNDGVQDTISVTGCGERGCAALWSDTIANGTLTRMGNILNTVSAGPFKLKANDTTQFLWAFSWNSDSTTIRQTIEGVVNSYLTNYEGPAPFSFPTVVSGKSYTISSAELIDSTTFGSASATIGAQITIRFPNINPVDPYMVRLVNKVRNDSIAGDANVRRVLRLNPGLLARLATRANDNLAAVLLFKSCNAGLSFTTTSGNSATCTDAPTRAVDLGVNAFAWRPLSTVGYLAGTPATGSVTETVQAGKSYLYSYVTRSRGFSDFKIVDSTAAGFIVTDVQQTLGFPIDTINSSLATAGPSTIQVYAPITNVAGRSFAKVDTSTVSGNATQSLVYGSVSNDVSGTSRVIWGNQFIVRKTVDTLTSATTTTVNVRWILPSAANSAAGPGVANFVARDQAFSVNQNVPVKVGTAILITGTQRGTSGSAKVYVDTISSPASGVNHGFVWVTGDNKPIFITNDQYAANREFFEQTSPLYPGYTVVPRDTANTANGLVQELTPFGAVRDRNFVLRGPNDTLSNAARVFVPQVQPIIGAGNKRIKGGQYSLSWLTDPFGSKAPFKLDPVADLQGVVNASLADASAKSTTVTETSAAVGALVGATTARPLQRVRLPFKMTFRDVDGRTEDVKFAMLKRASNTRLLGSGNDTVRVTIADSVWLPGDTLIVLQKVERDSSVGTGAARYVVVQADGTNGFRPIPVLVPDSIGINKFLVACTGGVTGSGTRPAADAVTCNPLVINSRGTLPASAGSASGGYLPVQTGWTQFFEFSRPFDQRSVVQLVATPFSTNATITKKDLANVSVVPNPYIARSDIDQLNGRTPTSRIYFTGVPEEGILRIYSVSGQFLQELTWTKSDLTYQGNNAPTGDLPFNLRTREGLDMGSGLYLYVLTATGSSGNGQIQRGKFVIIR
ncbi:MAG: hypothetical protein IPP90_00475 [Gemmatimonadaceae bacterium]|nr:hypothetical protein [Gemmatimonadaceae bacterium]